MGDIEGLRTLASSPSLAIGILGLRKAVIHHRQQGALTRNRQYRIHQARMGRFEPCRTHGIRWKIEFNFAEWLPTSGRGSLTASAGFRAEPHGLVAIY